LSFFHSAEAADTAFIIAILSGTMSKVNINTGGGSHLAHPFIEIRPRSRPNKARTSRRGSA
jgi:hypothetical protein